MQKKLEDERKLKEEANRKAEEEKNIKAREEYEKGLSDAEKERFRSDVAKNAGEILSPSPSTSNSGSDSSSGSESSSNSSLASLIVTRIVSGVETTVPLSPAFSSKTFSYHVTVPYDTAEVQIRPTVADTGKATLTVDGETASSGSAKTVVLGAIGTTKTLPIVVTAQNGIAKTTYTVAIYRQTDSNRDELNSIGVSSGNHSYPVFSPHEGQPNWTAYLPEAITEAYFTVFTKNASTKLIYNGTEYPANVPFLLTSLPVDNGNFDFGLKKPDGSVSMYTLALMRIPAGHGVTAALKNIWVEDIGANADYEATTLTYSAAIPGSATEVRIKPDPDGDWNISASYSVYDQNGVNVSPHADGFFHIPLNESGNTVIQVRVTSLDQSNVKTYSLILNRESRESIWGSLSSVSMELLNPSDSGMFQPIGPDQLAFNPDVLVYSLTVPANGIALKMKPTQAGDSDIRSVAVNGSTSNPDSAGNYMLSLSPGDNDVTIGVRLAGDTSNRSLAFYTFQVNRSLLPAGLTDWDTTNNADGSEVEWKPSGVNTFQAHLDKATDSITLYLVGIASAEANYGNSTATSSPSPTAQYPDRQKLVLGNLPRGTFNIYLTLYDAEHHKIGNSQSLLLTNVRKPSGISDWKVRFNGTDYSWSSTVDGDRYYVSIPENVSSFDFKLFLDDASVTASVYGIDESFDFSGITWLSHSLSLDEDVNYFKLKTVKGNAETWTDLVVVRDDTSPVTYDDNELIELRDMTAAAEVSVNHTGALFSAAVNSGDLELALHGYPSEDIVVTMSGVRLQPNGIRYDLSDRLQPGVNELKITLYSNFSTIVTAYTYSLYIYVIPDSLKLTDIPGAHVTSDPTHYQASLNFGQQAFHFKPNLGFAGATVSVEAFGEPVAENADGSYDVYFPSGLSQMGILLRVQSGGQTILYTLTVSPSGL
ncbi:cadherin-like beta sandwich domain-containing protein [Cohnella caldifontis]|uniref:cadherin-like beta sandwich domain-containing protein n=1 Tax=Cohnella caldifontis TaxID=3027471 RepID=UPI0023ED7CDD|nr:cadherin-like beta sandwich domain-containing protein [Cohnella sp. YIM B05605]